MPDVVLRAELLATGWLPDEVRRMCSRGDLRRLGRGAYARSGAAPSGRRTEHLLRVRAVLRRLGPAAVVSHASAAALYGLPCWDLPLDRVGVTRDRASGARRTPEVHVHAAPLADGEVRSVALADGAGTVQVTAPARTVVDIARTHGFEQGVVVADAAPASHARTPRRSSPRASWSRPSPTRPVGPERRPPAG